jgi:RimJ/RimL family protein N-acetyltransferase
VRLTTGRLELSTPADVDLDGLLAVVHSNPQFLATHNAAASDPRGYDRSMLEDDLADAADDPARHPLVIRLRTTSEVIGWAELLDEHPSDHLPWLGLLELHADQHGHGYGVEATEALVEWARRSGAPALRVGVDDGNDRSLAFWARRGFTPVDRRERPSPRGPLGVTVLELSL